MTGRHLCDAEGDEGIRTQFAEPTAYDNWAASWQRRMTVDNVKPDARCASMRAVNPAFISRNYIVEAVPGTAVAHQDFTPFEELREVLSRPYGDRSGYERYAAPSAPEKLLRQTVACMITTVVIPLHIGIGHLAVQDRERSLKRGKTPNAIAAQTTAHPDRSRPIQEVLLL